MAATTTASTSTPKRRTFLWFCFNKSLRYVGIGVGVTLVLALALVADVVLLQQSTYDGISRGMSAVTKTRRGQYQSSLNRYGATGSTGFKYPLKDEPTGLKLAWLMSFPNSGTSYTAQLVRDATKTQSASNYADETLEGELGFRDPVFDNMLDGPFWIKPEDNPDYTKPSEYALTKTHCGLRCTMCPPEKYAETTYSFRSKCFLTKWINFNATEGTSERVFSSYEADRLTKVIHLIRDPFDNVVSRYHLERELPDRLAAQYPKSREGFRDYCTAVDNLHAANEKRILFLTDALMGIMKDIPCHADFFRYVEWHNMAFLTTRDLELNAYVLHFESYDTTFDQTVKDMLDFLELPIHKDGELPPFIKGNSYEYYTKEEKQAIKKAFKIMSSPDTWSHVEKYFDKNEGEIPNSAQVEYVRDPACDYEHATGTSRPALNCLVREGSFTEITGDVQFLLDFAIVGFPKTATTSMLVWLSNQTEIQMYDHEVYHLKDGEPAEMVRQLYALPEGENYKRGYKAPRDIHNIRALDAFATYFPKTKFIIGLRHPVLWFESFYNYRLRNSVTLPETDKLIGKCIKGASNVCTDEVRYMDHLANLGKTDRTSPEEVALLSSFQPTDLDKPKFLNQIFLYETSQMDENDEQLASQYRVDLQVFLDLKEPISPEIEKLNAWEDTIYRDLEIDICDDLHTAVRNDLMDIAKRSSVWIRTYFLPLPDVHVSSPEKFTTLLEAWMIDPCIERRTTSRRR